MISFIHTADIHFGVENYGKIDPQTGVHTRLLDFERALNACIDYAIEQNVDLFVFAGDAYKTANPSPTQQKLLMKCLFRLYQAGIAVIIVVGNHDNPLSFGKATSLDVFGNIPIDGFHVVSKPKSFVVNTKNGPIQIVGIPWPARNNISINTKHVLKTATEITECISQNVAHLIEKFATELDPAIPAILTGHLTVTSGIFSGSEKRAIFGNDPVFMPSQLAIAPFDYVALGHLHRYQNLNPNGYPALVYSGSIERVDFGERKEDKGFCHIIIHDKGNTEHKFITSPMRKFIQIDCQLKPEEDLTQQLINEILKHDITEAVVKIIYRLPMGVTDNVNLRIIQENCQQAMYLVGVIPIREFETRQNRAQNMKVDMDLYSLLNTYFAAKPEFSGKRESLIEKALQLQESLDNQEIENEG
ncbi:MAG: exonuclease SbcCD subunit D [Candidatus Babeliales bacterium]|nr:exonuclease SbcCD subunit D [Candidatus Babeliales bacterium]